MATKLMRSYNLPPGKTTLGMGQAAKAFFRTYKGVNVTMDYEANGTCVISCVTGNFNNTLGIDNKIYGVTRKLTGNDVKITVTIIPKGNSAVVHYRQDISESLRATKAIFLSFALIGLSQLYGVANRREIPIQLNATIKSYLDS